MCVCVRASVCVLACVRVCMCVCVRACVGGVGGWVPQLSIPLVQMLDTHTQFFFSPKRPITFTLVKTSRQSLVERASKTIEEQFRSVWFKLQFQKKTQPIQKEHSFPRAAADRNSL